MRKRIKSASGPKVSIRAVFFDLGNVLVKFDANIAAEKFSGLSGLSTEKIWQLLFASDLERAYTKGEISSEKFYAELSKHFKRPVDFPSFCRAWNDIFWVNKGIEKVLTRIKNSKRYGLYLISNTNDLHFEFIKERFTVLSHFDRCFPSHEVGSRKPESSIFKHALREAKVTPKEAVFIDDIPEFVEAAQSVGMHGIQYLSIPKLEKDLRGLGVIF